MSNEHHSLEGWNIAHADRSDWAPWGGSTGHARAKVLGVADGHYQVLVEPDAGYAGEPHEHAHPEFLYVSRVRCARRGLS